MTVVRYLESKNEGALDCTGVVMWGRLPADNKAVGVIELPDVSAATVANPATCAEGKVLA